MGTPSVSNVNPIGPNVGSLPTTRVNLLGIDISVLQLANPSPDLLADMAMIYQTPNGSLYQSNGTSLVGMNSGTNIKTINGQSLIGTGDLIVTSNPISTPFSQAVLLDSNRTMGTYTQAGALAFTLSGAAVANSSNRVTLIPDGVSAITFPGFTQATGGDVFAAGFRMTAIFYAIDALSPKYLWDKGTVIVTAPGQVTALTLGVATSTTQPLTWTAPASNGGSALTDYFIEYQLAGAGSYTAFAHTASTTTGIVVNGLTASSSYNYRVSAVNAIGTGTASAVSTGSTAAAAGGFTETWPGANGLVSAPWTGDLAQANIAANQVYFSASPNATILREASITDGTYTANNINASGNFQARFYLRYIDASNYIQVNLDNIQRVVINSVTAGVSTASFSASAVWSDNVSFNLQIVLAGSTITAKVNGVAVVTLTGAATAGTKFGFGSASVGGATFRTVGAVSMVA